MSTVRAIDISEQYGGLIEKLSKLFFYTFRLLWRIVQNYGYTIEIDYHASLANSVDIQF